MPRWNTAGNNPPATPTNAGMWFDLGYGVCGYEGLDVKTAHACLVRSVANVPVSAAYAHYFERWKSSHAGNGGTSRVAAMVGRLALGLGEASVIEVGITLHHPYGVPMIPGSALKGLAAHYAPKYLGPQWAVGSHAFKVLFGVGGSEEDSADQGYVVFYDALYIPKSAPDDQPLCPDTVTVHHPGYYNQPGAILKPADYDDPTPIPFLSARGHYLVVLKGPDSWVTAAFQILAYALRDIGAGAKTSAGYGRLVLEGFDSLWPAVLRTALPQAPPEPDTSEWLKMRVPRQKLQALKKSADVKQQVRGFHSQWRNLSDPLLRQRFAGEIVAKVCAVGLESEYVNQAWYMELKSAATQGGEP